MARLLLRLATTSPLSRGRLVGTGRLTMDEVSIPHAKAFIDKSGTPYDRLLVLTWLPEHPTTDKESGALKDMWDAIAAVNFELSLHGRRHITWSDPSVPRG
jgi:hypothetical protein